MALSEWLLDWLFCFWKICFLTPLLRCLHSFGYFCDFWDIFVLLCWPGPGLYCHYDCWTIVCLEGHESSDFLGTPRGAPDSCSLVPPRGATKVVTDFLGTPGGAQWLLSDSLGWVVLWCWLVCAWHYHPHPLILSCWVLLPRHVNVFVWVAVVGWEWVFQVKPLDWGSNHTHVS